MLVVYTVLSCDDVLFPGKLLQLPPSRDQAPVDSDNTTVTTSASLASLKTIQQLLLTFLAILCLVLAVSMLLYHA